MARPIQKKWFGPFAVAGKQIRVNSVKFADGLSAGNAYIIKQKGAASYLVQDTAMTHAPEVVRLVDGTAGLQPGECAITATPFGGSALYCKKISQYRLSVYAPDGSPDSYSWSGSPATKAGQADLNLI